jgi:anion-transporting  ArsA/GET3 family ATPase
VIFFYFLKTNIEPEAHFEKYKNELKRLLSILLPRPIILSRAPDDTNTVAGDINISVLK